MRLAASDSSTAPSKVAAAASAVAASACPASSAAVLLPSPLLPPPLLVTRAVLPPPSSSAPPPSERPRLSQARGRLDPAPLDPAPLDPAGWCGSGTGVGGGGGIHWPPSLPVLLLPPLGPEQSPAAVAVAAGCESLSLCHSSPARSSLLSSGCASRASASCCL